MFLAFEGHGAFLGGDRPCRKRGRPRRIRGTSTGRPAKEKEALCDRQLQAAPRLVTGRSGKPPEEPARGPR